MADVVNSDYEFMKPCILTAARYPFLSRVPNPKVYKYKALLQTPSVENSEIRTGFTDAIAGGFTTPVLVDVKSASADDAAAGTGLQTLTIFGIGASSASAAALDYIEETITVTGTSAATTTNYWAAIIALKGATYGSGGKAAGAITIHENGGVTKTYATMAISTQGSINARFPILTGKQAARLYISARMVEPYDSGAIANNEGGTIATWYYGGNNEATLPTNKASFSHNQEYKNGPHTSIKSGNSSSSGYLTVLHQRADSDTARWYSLEFHVAVW
jgi:hypothetical protein